MRHPDFTPTPADHIEGAKGLLANMRLAVAGLAQSQTMISEDETWGMQLTLDYISDRLNQALEQLAEPRVPKTITEGQ